MVVVKRINPFAFRAELNKLQKKSFTKDTPLIPIDEGWWWAAFDGALLVGFACARPGVNYQKTVYLSRTGVLKSHKGQGIQDKFIKARIAFAKKAGYDFLVTDTYHNPPSANNLIDHGFKTFEPKHVRLHPETLTWYKDLKNKRTKTSNVPKAL